MKPLIVIALLFFSSHLNGQSFEKKLDEIVIDLNKKLNLNAGIAIGVIKDGKVFFEKTYGYADINQRIDATLNIPFYIASTTKSYISMLAEILQKEKLIKLDSPIANYLPGFVFKDPALLVNKITIRDLLIHKSGLKNEALVVRTGFTGEGTGDTDQILKLFENSQFTTNNFGYSNLGYILAGIIFEKVTGKRWQSLLQTKIFDPLDMSHTSASVWHLYSKKKIHPALGHTVINGKTIVGRIQKADANMHAGGGIFSSIKDSEKWLMLHMNSLNSKKISLTSEMIQDLHEIKASFNSDFFSYKRFGYDMGWYHSTYESDTLIQCFGSFPGGQRAHTSYMPGKKIGVVVFANSYPEGIFIPDILANFIYDNLLGKSDLDAKYEKQINNYPDLVNKFRTTDAISSTNQMIVTDSLPNNKFLGCYKNEDWGTICLYKTGDKVWMKWGPDALIKAALVFVQPNKYRPDLPELFSGRDRIELLINKETNKPEFLMTRGTEQILFSMN